MKNILENHSPVNRNYIRIFNTDENIEQLKILSKLLNVITVCSDIAPVRARVCMFVLRPLLFSFHSFLPLFLEEKYNFQKIGYSLGGTDF